MESMLPQPTPSNYLHHTLEPTQQRRKGFPSDDGRRQNQRQFISWVCDGITNKSKLNKVDTSITTFKNMKMQNVYFEDLFPRHFLPKLPWLNFYCAVCSAEEGLQRTRNYFQAQVVSQSHIAKATVTLRLTEKKNMTGMVTSLFTLNHVLFPSQLFYILLDDQNYVPIPVNQSNPLLKWSSGETPSSLWHWKNPYVETALKKEWSWLFKSLFFFSSKHRKAASLITSRKSLKWMPFMSLLKLSSN